MTERDIRDALWRLHDDTLEPDEKRLFAVARATLMWALGEHPRTPLESVWDLWDDEGWDVVGVCYSCGNRPDEIAVKALIDLHRDQYENELTLAALR